MASPFAGPREDPHDVRGNRHTGSGAILARLEPRWQAFVRQYRDPRQVVQLIAAIGCLFLPGQAPVGIMLILLMLLTPPWASGGRDEPTAAPVTVPACGGTQWGMVG